MAVPSEKIFTFGGDYVAVEPIYGHALKRWATLVSMKRSIFLRKPWCCAVPSCRVWVGSEEPVCRALLTRIAAIVLGDKILDSLLPGHAAKEFFQDPSAYRQLSLITSYAYPR
ncbi:hypothetical protein QA635_34220 [Bradyrhizobium brasilense]|uniref:hypothetical protein n=1 Tax=Bradyrhizobium brasilense TaxID=1419277 RepID=UPI0024B1DD58|nr:hypothetical protein [Bradyrhizobium australafricanum]WFU31531.1 hypothetical protein QA635_34220 [Bradyrhizobium australafricanum]